MAFDQPLEADQVDDLNLFINFVRAPIIGTLMWILGGDAKRQEEDKRSKDKQTMLDSSSSDGSSHSLRRSNSSTMSLKRKRKSALKKTPELIGSELSELGGLSDPLGDSAAMALQELRLSRSCSSGSASSKKKHLSWSDESGHDLVKVLQEESSHKREDNQNGSKDASRSMSMTRSRSVHANANVEGLEANQDEATRYLPKAMNRSHNGVIMPTMPYGSGAAPNGAGGIESPQWGWYTNITPPTPDMYRNRPMHKKQSSSTDTANTAASASTSSTANSGPNRVFQDLQERRHGTPMGWPSVPF